MFAKKNSLTIAVIWLILLCTGVIWYFSDTSTLKKINKGIGTFEKKLADSQSKVKRLTEVESLHKEINEKWQNRPKRIITADEPSSTISYLYKIISDHNLNIYYDFVLNDKKEVNKVTKFNFTIKGEGPYEDIYRMIWYLTYEPILYKINSLTLKKHALNSDYLRFTMKLQGFSVESEPDSLEDNSNFRLTNFNRTIRQHDIFTPLIVTTPKTVAQKTTTVKTGPKLPPKLPGQIDAEKASLKAVTSTSIFISEGKSGVKQLKVGDKVYLGKLVAIDQKNNLAVFVIEKLGKRKKITLSLDERK